MERRSIVRPGALLLLAVTACGEGPRERARVVPPSRPGVRISMAALHQSGGVPPCWRLTPPPGDAAAGRALFVELGCHTCHTVRGEAFSIDTEIGPDLTGMGTHHPPEYFAEAILNPDAVLVEGPGWIGADGRSKMPAYPDMTLAQLADLVAYLASLTQAGQPFQHAAMPAKAMPAELPDPPPGPATSFFVQTYEVKPEQLGDFEVWFRMVGARRFLAYDGLVGIETWVDVTHDGPPYVSVFGFRTDADRERFLADESAIALGLEWDSFIGPHPHLSFSRPPLYRVPTLSAP